MDTNFENDEVRMPDDELTTADKSDTASDSRIFDNLGFLIPSAFDIRLPRRSQAKAGASSLSVIAPAAWSLPSRLAA